MARTGRPVIRISLSQTGKDFLQKLSAKRSAPAAEVKRAKSVLLMAEGFSNKVISERIGFCAATIGSLRSRFGQLRLDGISDLPRSGPPRRIGDDRIEALIEKTLHSKPKGATHWSTRKMAKKTGIPPDSVSRIWRAFGLKPHRADSFQISTDPHDVDKVRDVAGLYMSPPENALVPCVEEKSRIQALERSQPVPPMRPGKPEGHTPEYHRHGTTSLFAALDVKTGKVLGKCYPRHRAKEFITFLKSIETHIAEEVAAGKEVHLVLDNYATHKSATVMKWLVIRRILDEAGIGQQEFLSSYRNSQNKEQPCYHLPRRECDLVISEGIDFRETLINSEWRQREKSERFAHGPPAWIF
ncbi:MAG: IS630 family transposase [Luteolibacter sp.]